jgi:diguanylate cyclase (GGDEF)-like protein
MKNKMKLFVCENFFPEVNSVCEKYGFPNVAVVPFPPLCMDKKKKAETARLLSESTSDGSDGVVLCSKSCDIIALIPKSSSLEIHPENYCFAHMVSEPIINYVLAKGGYIIGLGWLKKWRERILDAGFDQDTARLFYHDFCRELVFFDAGIDPDAEKDINELSQFLDLPYIVIPVELDCMRLMIENVVSEHGLHANSDESCETISEMEVQCAEYAAIFDLMGRIAVYANRRDAIEKVKEIFLFVFGAQQFKYWENDYENDSLPGDIKAFLLEKEREFLFFKEENRFCIKIKWNEKLFGVIDVSRFMFPKYIEKYLNFAIEIAKICGLVFSNNEQYEKILKAEREQRYSSTHDALTDLYNRTYINEIVNQHTPDKPCAVFMFDVDQLKYVNDNYGHAEGDKIIIDVAKILKKCFRESDIIARIGGDEFVAILFGTNLEAAKITKNRIKRQIEIHNLKCQEAHRVISFSIGYAVGEKSEGTIEAIKNKADENMYADKIKKRKQ